MHVAIGHCPLCLKLCRALFWCNFWCLFVQKKMPFLGNIRHCPNFLDQALQKLFCYAIFSSEDSITEKLLPFETNFVFSCTLLVICYFVNDFYFFMGLVFVNESLKEILQVFISMILTRIDENCYPQKFLPISCGVSGSNLENQGSI